MFHKITKISEAIPLVVPIDNTNGDWHVSVTSIDFWNGLRNLTMLGEITAVNTKTNKGSLYTSIMPGFYNFTDMERFFKFKVRKIFMLEDGVVRLQLKKNTKLTFNESLAKFLGFGKRLVLEAGSQNIVIADNPMNIIPCRLFNFHLSGIHGNSLNGQPSNIVKSIACPQTETGDLYREKYDHPQFMELRKEKFTQLFLELKDECGDLISNHGLPIHVGLEFKKISS